MKKEKKSYKFVLYIFILVAVLDIVGVLIESELLRNIFKPMIILSLMMWYYLKADKLNYLYILALAFSFLGDVLLLDQNYFIFGIASFLLTQVLFVIIFRNDIKQLTLKQKVISIVPFVIFYLFLLGSFLPSIGNLLIPVSIYGITISVFGMVCLMIYLSNPTKRTKVLLGGSILFIVSDSLIAINKFLFPELQLGVMIMITYVLAQYLICSYMLERK